MRNLVPFILVLALCSIAYSQKATRAAGGGWKREQSFDKSTHERSAAVSTLSTNSDKFFGRSGRGTLKVGGYLSVTGVTVYTFAKIVPKRFQDVKIWIDDTDVTKDATCVNSDESTNKFTCLISSSLLGEMLKGKTLRVEHQGTDDEKHSLSFNLVGLGAQLNFLEIKHPK